MFAIINMFPVISGNGYSDLISAAANSERIAFALLEEIGTPFAEKAAENHSRAAACYRRWAEALTKGTVTESVPDRAAG